MVTEIKNSFAVWIYNNFRLRTFVKAPSSMRTSLWKWSYSPDDIICHPKELLGLVLLQRGLWRAPFSVPMCLTDSSQYHHHLLDRIAVILFCCEMFCFEGTFAYIFTDQSYSSCFQVLKSNLTTAARLIKTKLNRVLPKSPAI